MWSYKAKASITLFTLSATVSMFAFAGDADARRQLVPDLPSVEIHLEVLQSLAVTPPNYASGYAAPATSAVPFAPAVQAQPAPQPVVQPYTPPAPVARQIPVQQPVAEPVQAFTPPEITQALQSPKPVAQPAPVTRSNPAPFARSTAAPIPRPQPAPEPVKMAAKAPTPPVSSSLPTRPIRSVAEGYKAPFATYEPTVEPAIAEITAPKLTAPKRMVSKAKPKPVVPQVKAPPKVEAPKPKAVAKAPEPKMTPKPALPAPAAVPTLAAPVEPPKVVAAAPAPEMPPLPEPDLNNMVFEPFPNQAEPVAMAKATPEPVMPELPKLPPAPTAPNAQPPAISAQPVMPLTQTESLQPLPDLGALTDEPQVNVRMPAMAAVPSAPPMPALPDLPPVNAPQVRVETPPMAEPIAPRTPQVPSNLPPLTAIIGEPDPTDGIVAEPLPELPSELPPLPSEPAPIAAPAPVVEPMPEIVMPDPIAPSLPEVATPGFPPQDEPVLQAPQEFELAALPAPPPSEPIAAAPSPAVSPGGTALTLRYDVEETRLPDSKKAELERIAQQIINTGASARIVGYAGGPPEQSSLTRRVSLARVLDVRAHLINFGVPANKVTPQSLGNKGAGSSNPDRVEIILQ